MYWRFHGEDITVRKREEGWNEREHEFDLYLVYSKCEYLYHPMCYSAASLDVHMLQARALRAGPHFVGISFPRF
jgi:hypothetical protein